MTASIPTSPPSLGDLLYLASYVFRVDNEAVTTFPDTPNQYSAELKVMGDTGEMDLTALQGPPGNPGVGDFVLRDQTRLTIVNTVEELPSLTNTANDIGKYWLLDTLDAYGGVIMTTAYVWYGASYRPFMMGAFGPPGPVPSIQPSCRTIPPGNASYVLPGGPTFQPSWTFELAVPAGQVGASRPVAFFPDIEEGGIETLNVLTATGYLESGELLWQPLRVDSGVLGTYSMPENAFNSYTGVAQRAAIGSFAVPPQPFPWTPIVWGHIGGIGGQGLGGLLSLIIDLGEELIGGLSGNPLTVGCEVLLGDPVTGTRVGRGFGNQIGVVNIYPHYSTPGNPSASITPKNSYAVVPAYHTDPAQGTVYVNLYNDGGNDFYQFTPTDAQLFIGILAINAPPTSLAGLPRSAPLHGRGVFSSTVAVKGKAAVTGGAAGRGVLAATAYGRG